MNTFSVRGGTDREPGSNRAEIIDRARGCLLGLAVGDALGTTLEFSRRDQHPLHKEMTGGGPFNLNPGEWTDDTSMALALAESLLSFGDINERDLMTRFLAWRDIGDYSCTGSCFDIGITTNQALARFQTTGDPRAGSTSERTAGNGSLMRVAPVALFALMDAERASRIARCQSATTHAAPQAVEACDLFVAMLREAILGAGKDAVRSVVWDGHDAIATVAAGTWRSKTRDEISSSGYVVQTIEAALWSVNRANSFEEAIILAVNLGDDSDTVGAVTGQIAGAIWGASSIPPRWLERLAWRERIEGLADSLLKSGDD